MLTFDQQAIATICQKYHAESLAVFGSYSRGDNTPGSDLDLLVKFSPNSRSGLFALSAMRDDLENVFDCKVDLLTEGFLSKHFRNEVLGQAKTIYVKA